MPPTAAQRSGAATRVSLTRTVVRIAVAALVAAAIIWCVLLLQASQKQLDSARQPTLVPPSTAAPADPGPTPLTTRTS